MKFYSKLLAIAAVSVMVACGASTKFVGAWSAQEPSANLPYKKVYIIGLSENIQARTAFENAVAEKLAKAGVAVEMSTTHYPPTYRADTDQKREEVLVKIRELGCDAIMTMALKDVMSESRYVPGTRSYPAVGIGYYGGWGTYVGYTYGAVYEPGYYTEDQTYFLETNVFDANDESLQWSAQSKTYNPSSMNSFSEDFSNALTYELTKNKIVASK
ncbi:hypothetical protein [Phaeocystidibacter luteus]|uniref:DUF4136 domain-containing protein n=1 Tax=Phaeocystidibacter luteus TaxID=911197 RepID=A0A6N6RMN2_9FLAO|nr:hypothetical protein [Phaeocystidibacter luteus]KAB2814829.1 hypothetical protein F8C67_03510 [Phaeocystidibacter luteus]